MDEIRFSIIIPVYHAEKYLEQCLDSVVHQTYGNLEIILVHDRTEDRSGEICDSYARQDKRIIVIHREKGDVSSARNAGLDIATGDYIVFVDSDDWIELTYCEEMRKIIHTYGPVDMIKTDYFMEGRGTYLMKIFCKGEFVIKSLKGREHLQLAVLSRYYDKNYESGMKNWETDPSSIWAGIYQKDIISSIRFQGNKCEDVLFNLQAIQHSKKIIYKPLALYHYRQNMDSAMVRYDAGRINAYLFFYDKCFGFMDKYKKDERFYVSLSVRMVNHIIANINYTIVHPDSPCSVLQKREKLKNMMDILYYRQALERVKRFRCFSAKVNFLLLLLRLKCYGTVIFLGEIKWHIKRRKSRRQ